MKYRHVVLVSLDTLRADAITAQGRSAFVQEYAPPTYATSALDALISQGTYFSNCISAAPYTSASHAAYFTGCWPRKNGVYEFFNRRLVRPTIFERASCEEWTTIFQTDFPIILGESLGFKRGIDHYIIENEKKALEHTIHAARTRNTLSFFHFGGIHYPYGFHRLSFAPHAYPNTVKHMEKEFQIDPCQLPADILDESYRNTEEKSWLYRYKHILDVLCEQKKYGRINRLYLDGIEYFLTHRFAPFLKHVLEFVDTHDALLVLFSDHGESWNDHSRGHANSIDHAVLHVPLLFYGKNIPSHRVISELVRTIDLVPTLDAFMGLSRVPVDGRALPGLSLRTMSTPRTAFSQVWRVGNFQKVHDHQKHILEKKRIIRPLKTHLAKEAVYHRQWVLQMWHQQPNDMHRYFRRTRNGQLHRIQPKLVTKKRLEKFLRSYHHMTPEQTKRLTRFERKIVDDLQLMGYRI